MKARGSWRTWLVAACIAVGVATLLADGLFFEDPVTGNIWDEPDRWWVFQGLESPGDDFTAVIPTLADVTSRYSMHIGLSVAMAAREVAGEKRPTALFYPDPLEDILVPGRWNNGEYFPDILFVNALTGDAGEMAEYDPIVDASVVDDWNARASVIEFPWNVRLVAGARPEGIAVLHYDPVEQLVYIVPRSLSPARDELPDPTSGDGS